MKARRLVSRVVLDEWLTAEIRKVPGCENCALASRYIVGEPRKNNGCNWAALTIHMGEGAVAQVVTQAAAAIEQRASLLFNLDMAAPRLQVERLAVQMSRRLLYTPVFHLDAGLIDARQYLSEVRQLERWRQDGVILLNVCGAARDEAREARADRRPSVAGEHVIFVRAHRLGANIMSPPEAVAHVRRQIAKRDAVDAEIAEATGQALPDWTGRD